MRTMLTVMALLVGCATDPSSTAPLCQDLGCPNPKCTSPDNCTCVGQACSNETPPTREFKCLTRRTCVGSEDQSQSLTMWSTDKRSVETTLINDCSVTTCDGALTCEAICCEVDVDC